MKTKVTQSRWTQRLAAVTATTIIAGTPFLAITQNAQADPPRHAPAWGYRNRNNDDRNDNRRKADKKRDKRYDRNDRRNRNDRYDRNDRNDRDGRYNRDDRYNRTNRTTDWGREGVRYNFGGVVTSELGNGRFVMRADNGRTVTVAARQRGVTDRINRGDRIVVAGYFRNNIFDAEDLNFTSGR